MHALTALLLLAPLGDAPKAIEVKANQLLPRELADGWLSLFDGETTFGWQSNAKIKVVDGALKFTGGDKLAETLTSVGWGSFELRFEYRESPKHSNYLVLKSGNHQLSGNNLESFDNAKDPTRWISARVIYNLDPAKRKYEERCHFSFSGTSQGEGRVAHDLPADVSGLAQVGFAVGPGSTLFVRNIKIKPLGLKPLFNGKDLAGWKVHPGKKSAFSVTPEGWLNVKDGPGDLQTEGQWANFVFQCECISNGKHLNSGIFFRARPGEYQQGYEAQIRNQFTPEPTQEYTIEEFDAKTNEATGKKKMKFTAVDYGTGAIYRRMPARKQLSRDGEWFGLTVVAQGRHMATWVNGIQVVDWVDNRPLKDNARQGCCLQKGAISIQGHDPTTDLSFRNLRIAELP